MSDAFKPGEWSLCPEPIPKRILRAAKQACENDRTLEISERPSRGTCHLCGAEVKAGREYRYKWPSGSWMDCPNCGRKVFTYRQSNYFWDSYFLTNLGTIERGKDGRSVFIRQWHVKRSPSRTFEGPEQLIEVARYAFRGKHIAKWTKEHRALYFGHIYFDPLKEWTMQHAKKTWVYDDFFDMAYPDKRQMRAITRGTSLEYASLNNYRTAVTEQKLVDSNVLWYFSRFVREKAFEKLTKAGYWKIATSRYGKAKVKWQADTIEEALGIPTWILRLQKPNAWKDDDVLRAQHLTRLYKAGRITMADITIALQAFDDRMIQLIEDFPTLKVAKIARRYHPGKDRYGWHDYIDYIREASQLGYDLTDDRVLYPKDIIDAHARTISQMRYAENEILRKAFRKVVKDLRKLAWETDDLLIRPAASQTELIREGKKLHHCVGSYAERMAKGETAIFLIRKKEDPKTPYYTLELRQGKIVQCRTLRNESYEANETVSKFVKAWTAQIAAAA